MPPRPHFSTNEEIVLEDSLFSKLDQAVRNRLQIEWDRIYNDMQYRLVGRGSMDDALRLFLIADKGFSLEQVMNLGNLSNEEITDYFDEFINTYAYCKETTEEKIQKASEENLFKLGDMHRRALEKINDYTFPDYSQIHTVNGMVNAHRFLKKLSLFTYNLGQDTETITKPELKLAYYTGAGGKENLVRLKQPLDIACSNLQLALPTLEDPKADHPLDRKAQFFRLSRNQLLKYSGKKLGDLNIDLIFSNEALFSISGDPELMKPKRKGYQFPEEGMQQYRDYLEGNRNDIEPSQEFDEAMSRGIRDTRKGFEGELTGNLQTDIFRKGIQSFLSCPHPDTGTVNDLFTLPEEEQRKLQLTYLQMFDRSMSGIYMVPLFEKGYGEFDLIRLRGGESIRQLVERKYQGKDEITKYQAMMMEAARHALTDGVMVMDFEINEAGVTIIKPGIAIAEKTEEELRTEESSAIETGLSETRAAREAMFLGEDGGIMASIDTLTPEQLEAAAGLYDQIYGTPFNSTNMRYYRELHPEMQDVDFFRVGGMSLRNFLGTARLNELVNKGENAVKAEILRMSTDPKIALSLSTMKYDGLNDAYSSRNPYLILDMEDKLRIRAEYPQLDTFETYKNWKIGQLTETNPALQEILQNYDDDSWRGMYHQDFHNYAAKGFTIPMGKVVSEKQLSERAEDPLVPHSYSFEALKTIYGPRPLITEGWVGMVPGTKIYTKDNFLQHAQELQPGGFSENDFTLVAYCAAMSPDVVVTDPFQNVPEEWLPRAERLRSDSNMWTTDICGRYPMPRENFGDAFLGQVIKPAREAAASTIQAFENGNSDRMEAILAYGMSHMLKNVMTTADISDPKKPTAFKLHMIRKLNDMLDSKPELKEKVFERLTPEEKERIQMFVRLEEVMNQSLHAKARLDAAEKNGEDLSAAEKDELTKKVDAFNFYAAAWERNSDKFTSSPQYSTYMRNCERLMTERMNAHPGDPAPGQVLNCQDAIYKMDRLKPAPDLKEALLSQDPYVAAEKIRASMNRLQQYYDDELQKLENAVAVLNRDGADHEEASPEECDAAVRDKAVSQERLEELRLLLESRLTEHEKDKVRDEYNDTARMKDWDTITRFEENRDELSPVEHPEKFKAYFTELIKVFRDDNKKAYRIDEDIADIKDPTDLSFDEKLKHPMTLQLNRIIANQQKLMKLNPEFAAEDLAVLRQAADHLAEPKEKVAAYLGKVKDPAEGNAVRMENMLRGSEGYDAEAKSFSGLLTKKRTGAGMPSVQVVTENTREAVQDLLWNPPALSDELRNAGLHAIEMMEERSMLEETPGSRTLAHGRTARHRTELAAAVENGVMQDIKEADRRYSQALANEEEVFNYIRDTFPADSWVPKDMNLTGNKNVPPKFSLDTVTDSRMNGLWEVGMTARKLGISTADFINNPGLYLMRDIQMKLSEKGLSAMTKPGDDFAASVEKLYTGGRSIVNSGSLRKNVLGGLTGEEYVEKAIGNLYLMESDPERRKGLAAYTKKIGQLIEAAVVRENVECMCLYKIMCTSSTADKKQIQELRDGLKAAFFSGGRIGKEHLPVPYTIGDGVERQRPVKYQTLLARRNAYAELTAIYKKNLPGARESKRNDVKLMIQETLLDYLKAHPEDRDKKEYKNLEKLALSADTDLGIAAPRNEAELEKTPKAGYNRWKQEFASELRNLENAVVRDDQEVNRSILDLQHQAEAAARGRNRNLVLAGEKMEQIETVIQNRQEQLLVAWQRKEITEHYFRTRYDQLHEVLMNPGRRLPNPPKFTDKRNAERYASDMAMINNRISCCFGNGRFRNMESFREWTMSQPGVNREDYAQLTPDVWKHLYRLELFNHNSRKGAPDWMTQKQTEAANSIQIRKVQREQHRAAAMNAAANHAAPQQHNAGRHGPAHNPGH